MTPGPSLVVIGVLVLGGTLLAAVFARQADALTRASRFFLLLATVIGVVAVCGGTLDIVAA